LIDVAGGERRRGEGESYPWRRLLYLKTSRGCRGEGGRVREWWRGGEVGGRSEERWTGVMVRMRAARLSHTECLEEEEGRASGCESSS
jgi:hypothetical protein